MRRSSTLGWIPTRSSWRSSFHLFENVARSAILAHLKKMCWDVERRMRCKALRMKARCRRAPRPHQGWRERTHVRDRSRVPKATPQIAFVGSLFLRLEIKKEWARRLVISNILVSLQHFWGSNEFFKGKERWQSGRLRRSWKPLNWEVPGVRIPLSPLNTKISRKSHKSNICETFLLPFDLSYIFLQVEIIRI